MEYIVIELSDLPKRENNRIRFTVQCSFLPVMLFGQMLSMHLFGVWAFYIHLKGQNMMGQILVQ